MLTRKARTLIAMLGALVATLAVAQAAAASVVVRVETPSSTMVPRTEVTPQPIQLTDKDGGIHTCGANSVAAVLEAGIGHGNWAGSVDSATGLTKITTIRGLGPTTTPWQWAVVAGGEFLVPAQTPRDLCTTTVPENTEALFYPLCTDRTKTVGCFTGGPLYMLISGASGLYDTKPAIVPGLNTAVSVLVAEITPPGPSPTDPNTWLPSTNTPSTDSTLDTDEGGRGVPTNKDRFNPGVGEVQFAEWGDHWIRASETGKVPERMPVCATQGGDGFCGTTKTAQNPFIPPDPLINCATNGHDGYCGTVDTSGPVVHVANIKNKQVFKKKKGPGQLKGTMDVDPAGVGEVKVRLSRQVRTKVLIKPKKKTSSKKKTARKSAVAAATKKKPKKRYRTVTRCTVWDDGTLNLETAKCGKAPKWFNAELSDLRYAFSYSFAMTLPAGTYTLEVQSKDEDGHLDPPTPGRNVLTFTVQ